MIFAKSFGLESTLSLSDSFSASHGGICKK